MHAQVWAATKDEVRDERAQGTMNANDFDSLPISAKGLQVSCSAVNRASIPMGKKHFIMLFVCTVPRSYAIISMSKHCYAVRHFTPSIATMLLSPNDGVSDLVQSRITVLHCSGVRQNINLDQIRGHVITMAYLESPHRQLSGERT